MAEVREVIAAGIRNAVNAERDAMSIDQLVVRDSLDPDGVADYIATELERLGLVRAAGTGRCWFDFHDWSVWTQGSASLVHPMFGKRTAPCQRRNCLRCGYAQEEML